MTPIAQEECVPCRDGSERLSDDDARQLWLETPMWEMVEVDGIPRLRRTYEFESYADGLDFAHRVGMLAEAANHHPTITIDYKKVSVEWYTHTVKGLHRNDFIMSAKTDEAYLDLIDATRAKSTVHEASDESFPASDPPGWIGKTQEPEHPTAG